VLANKQTHNHTQTNSTENNTTFATLSLHGWQSRSTLAEFMQWKGPIGPNRHTTLTREYTLWSSPQLLLQSSQQRSCRIFSTRSRCS